MSGKDIRETVGLLLVVASMVFVGLEIRQNTIVAQAAAYQEIGFNTGEGWRTRSLDPSYAQLTVLASDSSRWNEIDEAGWLQLRWMMLSSMRAWETVWVQVQQGLLPDEAMGRFGFRSPQLSTRHLNILIDCNNCTSNTGLQEATRERSATISDSAFTKILFTHVFSTVRYISWRCAPRRNHSGTCTTFATTALFPTIRADFTTRTT